MACGRYVHYLCKQARQRARCLLRLLRPSAPARPLRVKCTPLPLQCTYLELKVGKRQTPRSALADADASAVMQVLCGGDVVMVVSLRAFTPAP